MLFLLNYSLYYGLFVSIKNKEISAHMEQNLSIIESQLLLVTRQFLLEQETERAVRAVTLEASLDRELGIDSLGRVELFHRIEKMFAVQLKDAVMAQADTLHEIAQAIQVAEPAKKFFFSQSKPTLFENIEVDLSKMTTLQEVLIEYAIREPNRPHIYFQNEEGNEELITYGDLLAKSSCIANSLIAFGIKPDDTVAIMVPTSCAFFQSFFGVLLAGAVPVPIYPPFRLDRIEEYAVREAKILNNAEVRALITFAEAERLGKILKAHIPSLKWVTTADHLLNNSGALPNIPRTTDQMALIQYSSGSTGDPKGVLLNHENILANIRAIEETLQIKPTDVVVSWLPLYHDMGLMSWICSLYLGLPITILSPISFLNRPERWLWAIHYHRGTLSAAPNFAYELCVKRIDEEKLEGLDLSCWRLSFNGAEAVNPRTLERFYNRFKKYGFKKETIFPVYGLAENTVGLAAPELNCEYRVDKISRTTFENEKRCMPSTDKNALEFVSEGKALIGHEIRIVDEKCNLLPERRVGQVQFRGPSAMQGYYKNPTATNAVYHEGWWDTGDLGYFAEGELFITGRKKDLIIKAGRNIYPETIEESTGNVIGVRKGCVIAFGVSDATLGTEKIIIVAESKWTDKNEKTKLANTISEQVAIDIGIPPDQVVIVPLRKIPKTSSGKLQRSACKQAFLSGELTKAHQAVQIQMTKLFISAASKQFLRFLSKTLRFGYTLYVGVVFTILVVPLLLILLLSTKKMAARIIRLWTKLLLILAFCPVKVIKNPNPSKAKPLIYAANHFSYVDSVILLSILPAGTLFIGKKELQKWPIISNIINKLNFITVDRWDFSQNIEDAKHIQNEIRSGHSILIYPEGTFTYASGLRPFKSGAFQLACDTHAPICPIALKNTRKILRGDTFLLSPAKVIVTFNEWFVPNKNDWSEVNRLRTEVRKVIAKECGEPTIDIIVAGPELK